MSTNTRLDGKVALVTGAAQGLGFAIAAKLLDAGAAVALADIQEEKLEAALRELPRESTQRAAAFAVDLTVPEDVARLAQRAADRFGALDIVVNNAGVRMIHSFKEHPLGDWRKTMDVNLTAPFLLSQAAVPFMIARGKGKIVNLASVAADLGFKNRIAYNVSKAGVVSLTKCIALELGVHGIRCNAVSPGIVETSMSRVNLQIESVARIVQENTPLGGWGVPNDVAEAVLFLSSDASDFITGANLLVDGGWSTGKGF